MMLTAFDLLLKYATNLLSPKRSPKWRAIPTTSGNFKARIDCMNGARDILKLIGYCEETPTSMKFPDNVLEPDRPKVSLIAAELLIGKVGVEQMLRGQVDWNGSQNSQQMDWNGAQDSRQVDWNGAQDSQRVDWNGALDSRQVDWNSAQDSRRVDWNGALDSRQVDWNGAQDSCQVDWNGAQHYTLQGLLPCSVPQGPLPSAQGPLPSAQGPLPPAQGPLTPAKGPLPPAQEPLPLSYQRPFSASRQDKSSISEVRTYQVSLPSIDEGRRLLFDPPPTPPSSHTPDIPQSRQANVHALCLLCVIPSPSPLPLPPPSLPIFPLPLLSPSLLPSLPIFPPQRSYSKASSKHIIHYSVG